MWEYLGFNYSNSFIHIKALVPLACWLSYQGNGWTSPWRGAQSRETASTPNHGWPGPLYMIWKILNGFDQNHRQQMIARTTDQGQKNGRVEQRNHDSSLAQ